MGIYYAAVDKENKLIIHPLENESNKTPGLYHPCNSFSSMVVMKNTQGYAFEIINDFMHDYLFYSYDIKDITEEVYLEYKEEFKGYFDNLQTT